RLAERMASMEGCEFVEDFANPMPLAGMCELLGGPPEGYHTLRGWTTHIRAIFSPPHGRDYAPPREKAPGRVWGEVGTRMTAKKATPGGTDLISALVAVQQTEGRVSWDELRNLIVTLVFAAHDNTRYQFANAMVAFAEHPQQWTLLAEHPELAAQAVEELMRWCPSANALYRFAAED